MTIRVPRAVPLLVVLLSACATAPAQHEVLHTSASSATAPAAAGAALAYPATRTVDVVDDYHGTPVPDPYRWLEDLESEEVRAWAAAQTALFAEQVAADPLRDGVRARLRAVGDAYDDLPAVGGKEHAGGREFSIDFSGGRQVLHVRMTPGEEPRVLVDPATFSARGVLTGFRPSRDGRHVAYTISEAGSDWLELRVRDVSTGADLPGILHDLIFPSYAWLPDGSGLLYVRSGRPQAGDLAVARNPAVYHHRLGDTQAQDRRIFGTPPGAIDRILAVAVPGDGGHAFIYEGRGSSQAGIGFAQTRAHYLPLDRIAEADVTDHVRRLSPEPDAGFAVVHLEGPVAYALTSWGAPRRRLTAIDLRDPAPQRWRDVIPEAEGVLQRVHRVGGRWVALHLENVSSALRVFSAEGRPLGRIELPVSGTVEEIHGEWSRPEFTFFLHSYAYPDVVLRHNVESGATDELYRLDLPFDPDAYETRQLWFASKDGTRVPMIVFYRRGITLDGSHPTLLYGYGASGTVMQPWFDPEALSWVELGGVYAVANIRGGGEFGQAWHEAAILERKQTTFDDFIAAAEHLVAAGYTTPRRLAIRGGSFGGLLMGAVVTQRPDLFAAAIVEVPILDMLRYEAGRHEAQIGSARNPAQFPFLYAYSPLHRVVPGTCYPATLVTTALNDTRAPAWHAFKFTAALQAAQSCPQAILLRASDVGGHAGALGLGGWAEVGSDILAFAARHTGLRVAEPGTRDPVP